MEADLIITAMGQSLGANFRTGLKKSARLISQDDFLHSVLKQELPKGLVSQGNDSKFIEMECDQQSTDETSIDYCITTLVSKNNDRVCAFHFWPNRF